MAEIMEMYPEMLTINEAAARIGLSYGIVRRLCLNNPGKFYIKIGNKTYINWNRFNEFLKGENRDEE